MAELEKEVESALRIMIERHGGLCLKWVCPGWSGVPDRIILLPGGRVLFAELKRPRGGKVAPLQAWWSNRLAKLGFCHVFLKNQADIIALELFIERSKL